MSGGVATEVLCRDCEGGPERCAREGHVRTWPVEGVTNPNVAVFVCGRCNETFTLPRCASCGEVLPERTASRACSHPGS